MLFTMNNKFFNFFEAKAKKVRDMIFEEEETRVTIFVLVHVRISEKRFSYYY